MIAVGILLAGAIYFIVAKTRIGMLIRAGASNREMLGALGINVSTLFTLVFAMGCVFSGLAGIMISPISTVESGMGDPLLIIAFVVIIIGGIGSIRGAFVAAIIAGLTDTIGRTYIPELLRTFTDSATADTAGPALASMLIYLLMALVLVFRPAGLFAAKSG
jgi:branched-chain amino acid transport system permease protein